MDFIIVFLLVHKFMERVTWISADEKVKEVLVFVWKDDFWVFSVLPTMYQAQVQRQKPKQRTFTSKCFQESSYWSHPVKSFWSHPVKSSCEVILWSHPVKSSCKIILWSHPVKSSCKIILRSFWGHSEVILESSWSHPEAILRSEGIMKSSWSYPVKSFCGVILNLSCEVNRKSSWNHYEVILKSS